MMSTLPSGLLMAGAAAIFWAGVIVNITAPWLYDYRRHLPRDESLRQIFIGQAVWVTMMLAVLGTVCAFYWEAVLQSLIACVLLLAMWSSRLALQLWSYRGSTRMQHPVRYWVFTAAFVYQVAVFGAASAGWLRP